MDRRKQLEQMTVLGGLEPLARQYNLDIAHMKKSEIVNAILAYENPKPEPEPESKEVKRRPPRNAAQTKLKALRVKSGLKQKDVALEAGLKLPVYSQYEQGIRNIDGCKLITLLKICKVLECNLVDIVESPELIELLTLNQFNY